MTARWRGRKRVMGERRANGAADAAGVTVFPAAPDGDVADRADGVNPGELAGEAVDLAAEVAALRTERDGLIDQLQRERADFANFRRRVDGERALARQHASRDILLRVLPVLDDFDRAMAAVPADQPETGWISGTRMVGKKLASVLEAAGVTPVPALGERFDPALHEAVATEPGSAADHVVEVYQGGYRLAGNLLRPAMVKTGDAPATPAGSDVPSGARPEA